MLIAAATVPTFLTAIASSFGTVQQKGTVMGIFRSLGALARAFGPVVASFGMSHCPAFITLLHCIIRNAADIAVMSVSVNLPL